MDGFKILIMTGCSDGAGERRFSHAYSCFAFYGNHKPTISER